MGVGGRGGTSRLHMSESLPSATEWTLVGLLRSVPQINCPAPTRPAPATPLYHAPRPPSRRTSATDRRRIPFTNYVTCRIGASPGSPVALPSAPPLGALLSRLDGCGHGHVEELPTFKTKPHSSQPKSGGRSQTNNNNLTTVRKISNFKGFRAGFQNTSTHTQCRLFFMV